MYKPKESLHSHESEAAGTASTEAVARVFTRFSITQVKFYARRFDISCLGIWVPRLEAFIQFTIKFDSQ